MKNSDDYIIVQATEKDDETLRDIGLTCYACQIDPEHQYWLVHLLFRRYFSKRKFAARRKQGVMIYCLKKGTETAGFYELEKDGLLSSLYVLPSFQHTGYGSALLEDAKERASACHLKEIRLDASEFAVSFYQRHGFKKAKEARQILGITLIPMKKRISKA